MSIRPRTLAPFVVVALLLVAVAGCSDGAASVNGAATKDPSTAEDPSADGTEAEGSPCNATATVGDTTYHVVRAMSDDYGVKPDLQVEGSATDCSGNGAQPTTFHAIPQVDPDWALCGLVDGQWRVFLADDMAVPANSTLARIVVGG
jgi:hypothetical protein